MRPVGYPPKHAVKVYADSQRVGPCKKCGDEVQWYFTAAEHRWMLFDGGIPVWKRRHDVATNCTYLYLDRRLLHWNHCGLLDRPVEAATG